LNIGNFLNKINPFDRPLSIKNEQIEIDVNKNNMLINTQIDFQSGLNNESNDEDEEEEKNFFNNNVNNRQDVNEAPKDPRKRNKIKIIKK
jgi:hypothetical protein